MPTHSPEASGPRKRKLLTKVTTNGDPKSTLQLRPLRKQRLQQRQLQNQPYNHEAPPMSIEIEEDEDELDYHTSIPPHNPQRILEAADGSDDDVNTLAPARDDESTNKEGEAPEESDEAGGYGPFRK